MTAPKIDIEKSPDAQSVNSGAMATFTIKVKNTGDVPLTGVHVSDLFSPDCNRSPAQIAADPNSNGTSTLAPDETYEYTCTTSALLAAFTNTATATGTPPVGADVTDSDTADVSIESLSTTQDFVPNDSATLGGLVNTPNGKLRFKLYKGDCVDGNLVYDSQDVPVTANGSYGTTNTEKLSSLLGSSNTAGTYNWQVTYSGDTHGNADIVGACGTEKFTVDNG